MDSGYFLNAEKHFYKVKNALFEGVIEFILIFLSFHCGFILNLNVTLSLTTIGIIYNKITHLVLRTREIEHILINVNTSLRSRKMLEKLYKMG